MLNSREMATLCWLGIAVLWVLNKKELRRDISRLLKLFLQPPIIISLLAMFAWIGCELWIGNWLSLWSAALVKGTVLWVVGTAIVLLFNCQQVSSDPPHFVKQTMFQVVGVVVFVEYFINLYVMSLPVELVLQPVILILTLCATVGSFKPEYRSAKMLCAALLAVGGVALFIFTARGIYLGWREIDAHALLLDFALPVWLTIGLLPFVYCMSLVVAYDSVFRRVNSSTPDSRARWCARTALLTSFHICVRDLNQFHANWIRRLSAVSTFTDARRIIGEFRQQQRERARTVADEQERLRRYAGSDSTDEEGRRLDRREFKETIDALLTIHTCQMGWFRNRGERYRDDLLQILDDSLTRHGLPSESGVTLRVSEDGQSWYAWRRTVTGWCFAIGAAGAPPDQWKYDGAEPPKGYPGNDQSWGSDPFSDEVSPNWY